MLGKIEEFDIQKLENDHPDFFEETPFELLEFIFSENTISKITEICVENGVKEEEKIKKAAYQIALVLLGQSPEEKLTVALKKELGIDLETANKISDESNKLILSQAPLEKIEEPLPEEAIEKTTTETLKPSKNDAYKETIE